MAAIVYNHDVAGLARRINRFIEELMHSSSAGGSQMTEHDQARLSTYFNALTTYVNHIVSEPLLDLPETHPREIVLDENPNVVSVENESVRDVIMLLELARDETVSGQSARMASTLVPFDKDRLMSIVEKADRFLTSYIQTTTPLDLPESSPMRAMTAPGRSGV